MPTIPFRRLGQYGIIKDMEPYDLPLTAFSDGNNVRFEEMKVLRAPVFRKADTWTSATGTPRHCFGVSPANASDYTIVADTDGNLYQLQDGSITDYTKAGFSGANSDEPWSDTILGNVVYVNRVDEVPRYLGPADTEFDNLTGWDSTWRCKSLRGFRDFLIAINVTKGATAYPTMIKWSDSTENNVVPGSWDITDTTGLAGENVLAEVPEELVDGAVLRNQFIIYGRRQIWAMEFIGGRLVFSFRKLFDDAGVINLNCVVEVEGLHYVFGQDDIYVHDGQTKRSISDARVRDFVFNTINLDKAQYCFVTHNPRMNEVIYAYPSGESDIGFPDAPYVNRAVVYNYRSDTWALRDMPNVIGSGAANLNVTLSWDTVDAGSTWETIGSRWKDHEDGDDTVTFFVAAQDTASGLSNNKLLAYDDIGSQSRVAFDRDTETDVEAYVQRISMDLDEPGTQLRDYMTMHSFLPQVTGEVKVRFGSSIYPTQVVTWEDYITFDPDQEYKIDSRNAGRYLSYEFREDQNIELILTGFDLQGYRQGRR